MRNLVNGLYCIVFSNGVVVGGFKTIKSCKGYLTLFKCTGYQIIETNIYNYMEDEQKAFNH